MPRISRHSTVPAELAGMRLDQAAAVLFGEYSRSMLSHWIVQGELRMDGAAVKPKAKVLGGERLSLEAQLEPREDWAAADAVAFEVVYEDEALLVVNKPAGLVVHPGAGNPRGTLVNGLLGLYPQLAHLARAGIVHRLDKDTSGLLLVARTLEAQHRLGKMLARRAVSRRYLAVVEGLLASGQDIDRPLGRDPLKRTRQAVRGDGRPALTRVRVLQRFRAHTQVEATLETGRTHQIRVHLAAIGHPLVGDSRYGARGRLPRQAAAGTVAVLQAFRRQALHAWKLTLEHPLSGEMLRLRADPPADLGELLTTLQEDLDAHGP
ncbi:MAG: 23S rRNA pseudouridine(1911/1915/1917) synthase RluD [Gammaproteobacteria bacterium]|nr:23S rRNA pseudouridine(1911/1915/1917) synthase RluD [Gammaproteobacteria bacterium]